MLITRAVISDICIAAVVALLISLIPLPILQFILGIPVCIQGSANVEHIMANGANMDVAFSKYLTDPAFLSGSVFTADLALLVAVSIGVFCCGVVFIEKIRKSQRLTFLKFKASTLSVGILSAISTMLLLLIPVTLVNANWTQANYLEENIKAYLGENDAEQSPITEKSEILLSRLVWPNDSVRSKKEKCSTDTDRGYIPGAFISGLNALA